MEAVSLHLASLQIELLGHTLSEHYEQGELPQFIKE